MIKRDKRNLGRRVIIHGHKDFDAKEGKVMGFRGDHAKGNPIIQVFVYPNYGVWPFPGSDLVRKKW